MLVYVDVLLVKNTDDWQAGEEFEATVMPEKFQVEVTPLQLLQMRLPQDWITFQARFD